MRKRQSTNKRISVPNESVNFDETINYMMDNGEFPLGFDFEQILQIKNSLRVKRRRAFREKNNEELRKIDSAISLCDNPSPKKQIQQKQKNEDVVLSSKERTKLYAIIDSLLNGSELNTIKPAVIPKMEKALNERHQKALDEHEYDDAKI